MSTQEPRYCYLEMGENGDPVEVIVTRSEILRDRFEWWKGQMIAVGKADQATEDNCVEDFCVVNWAHEVKR